MNADAAASTEEYGGPIGGKPLTVGVEQMIGLLLVAQLAIVAAPDENVGVGSG